MVPKLPKRKRKAPRERGFFSFGAVQRPLPPPKPSPAGGGGGLLRMDQPFFGAGLLKTKLSKVYSATRNHRYSSSRNLRHAS